MGDIAVLIPGTASDEVFVASVFAGPLASVGLDLVAVAPKSGDDLVSGHLAALDAAAREGPIVAGGISLGAHLAAEWALANPDRCAGLLLAMPAWHGAGGEAPAAVAARAGAVAVDALGTEEALAAATVGTAPWLAAELSRAWRRQGTGLAASLRTAADHQAPSGAALGGLRMPAGVAACVDDPVHPLAAARSWTRALGKAELGTTSLAALGRDRESLGRATVLAWLRAGGRPGAPLLDK
ncbi:MAG TPA: alpha/beta hydrolase [Pseudonocardiaceae bacterium]|nr:alpha/beta hydrolase [Pseudonocardiaceae bacterium]